MYRYYTYSTIVGICTFFFFLSLSASFRPLSILTSSQDDDRFEPGTTLVVVVVRSSYSTYLHTYYCMYVHCNMFVVHYTRVNRDITLLAATFVTVCLAGFLVIVCLVFSGMLIACPSRFIFYCNLHYVNAVRQPLPLEKR